MKTRHRSESSTCTQPLPAGFSRDWLWGLILVVAVVLVYQPVWRAGFIWDDETYITNNPNIVGLHGLEEIWTTSAADISPLTFTTFWLEHAAWGLVPLPYHLVNVLLHSACAIVLWRVLLSLQVPGAWLGAALWALHPVEVESVAWITETKNTESGLFFLLSILFFLKWLEPKDSLGRAQGGRHYALSLIFAALAMASKSSTVILPGVLCLCAWRIQGRWQWRNLARVAPVVLMAIATSALSIWTQKLQLAAESNPQWVRLWPERLAAAGDAVWFYLGKLFWPHPLVSIYPRWAIDTGRWTSYVPLLAMLVILLILWTQIESWSRPWFFVFAYFLVALAPVLGLIDNYIFRYSLVFDHLQYLASMGPLALAGAGLAQALDFVARGKPWFQAGLGAGLLLVLGILSWEHVRAYESEETLWTDILSKNPYCWLAYTNLGKTSLQKGKVDEAIAQFRKALEINPNFALAHNDLGDALVQKGAWGGAIAQFRKALEIEPGFTQIRNNLYLALLQKQSFDEQVARSRKILESDPSSAQAHNNLGNDLLQKGEVDEAIVEYQKAMEIDPDMAEIHYNLGNALTRKNQVDDAISQYQKALELNPNYAKARTNLGVAFAQKGEIDEAIVQFQYVVRLNPGDATAQQNLAKAQAMAMQSRDSP